MKYNKKTIESYGPVDPVVDFGKLGDRYKYLVQTWDELREKLYSGEFRYDDILSAKGTTYLKVLDDFFHNHSNSRFYEKKCHDLRTDPDYVLVRGTVLKDHELLTHDRIMPCARYINDDNRFSPEGVEWLYIAVGSDFTSARQCSIAECRAEAGKRFGCYQFQLKPHFDNKRVVDLTIANGKTYDDLCEEFNHYAGYKARQAAFNKIEGRTTKDYRAGVANEFSRWWCQFYVMLLSGYIFTRVDEIDAAGHKINKKYWYAPFQCLAKYFDSLGYVGIIYNSTVSKDGRNLVLFDKKMAELVGKPDIQTL